MKTILALALLALSSPAFAQASVRGCCVDPGFYASPEARRLAADLADRQRRWEAEHRTVAPVVTAPTFGRTYERP